MASRVPKVLSPSPSWLCMPSPLAGVLGALTWSMGLAVILQVIQAPAHYLHGHLILPWPRCQPQIGLQDAACPGPNGPAAIYSHGHAHHCPTKLVGKGWRVAPATCGSSTRPSWSQGLPKQPKGSYAHPHSHKGLTGEIHTSRALSHHPLPGCWQLHWLHGDKVLGRHHSLADQDLSSPLVVAGSSHQQGWPAKKEGRDGGIESQAGVDSLGFGI